MIAKQNLEDVDSHFAFGENWAQYAQTVRDVQIKEAISGLQSLLGGQNLHGKSFLDIGCGSGIHSVAAARLGASRIVALDIDPDAVATTRRLLRQWADQFPFEVSQVSALDLTPEGWGRFDVVYSWGALHHTGRLAQALQQAAAMVTDGGSFAFALYRRTWMCPLWRIEKRWYSRASPAAQERARRVYARLFRFLGRRRFDVDKYIDEYWKNRGMDFYHDMHDWLGGYPYESILPDEVEARMVELGFVRRAAILSTPRRGRTYGLLGSGCDQYLYVKESRATRPC